MCDTPKINEIAQPQSSTVKTNVVCQNECDYVYHITYPSYRNNFWKTRKKERKLVL